MPEDLLDLSENIGEFFTTPIIFYDWPDSDGLNGELRDLVLAKEAEGGAGKTLSNFGGWHSQGNIFTWDAPPVRVFETRVMQLVMSMTRAMSSEQGQKYHYEYNLTGWANINRSGCYNNMHNHPNWVWSGVYYVTSGEPDPGVPENGKLELLDPRTVVTSVKGLISRERPLIEPKPGMMVVFPSYLNHQVHPFFGKGERISIAFNVNIMPIDEKS